MGKVSPISIKYVIHAKFFAEGIVERPDVIGAIFGQTEGLLGDELELRELQKNGKIGRIEVNINIKESKTSGEIQIPTSIDKAETTIIAAAIETIERIGPCDAKVQISQVEDVRGGKREYVLERAKALLAQMSAPDSREMQSEVTTSVRKAQIREYGEEKLPAGPDIEKEEQLIVVEGRADVVNLLKYGIKNVIGMNGVSLPKTITELGETKNLILFIDGDRGGLLIAKDALTNAKISFIAVAPAGKEVEELTGKELISCLRSKISAREFSEKYLRKRGERTGERERGRRPRADIRRERRWERREAEEIREEGEVEEEGEEELSEEKREKLGEILNKIEGSRAACLIDSKLNVIKKVPGNELIFALRKRRVYAIVLDGLATNAIIRVAEKAKCKHFAARNFSVGKTKINLISF